MQDSNMTEDEVIKITEIAKIREKAFFTVIRQSGLQPNTVGQLKIKNLERIREEDTPIPCKIDVTKEICESRFGRHPSFVGEESVKYLKKYLAKRELADKEKITQESLLFITHKKPSNPIIVKETGRIFRKIARKVTKGHPKELSLDSLRLFFLQKSEEIQGNYLNYLVGESNKVKDFQPREDEFYRKLYKEIILDSLEIEPITKSMLRVRDNQIKDLSQKFDYLLLGYKDLQELAKPMIDFHSSREDGEMTIRMKQKTMSMRDAAVEDEQETEQESADQQNEDIINNHDIEETNLKEKDRKLNEWERTKEVEKLPRPLRVGETVTIPYDNVTKITTKVTFRKLLPQKTKSSKGNGESEASEKRNQDDNTSKKD